MYKILFWQDHAVTPVNTYKLTENADGTVTLTPVGEVLQQGTNMSATNFNNIETGIYDSHLAGTMILNALRQLMWNNEELQNNIDSHVWTVQTGTITLKNTLKFPFNNSLASVALVKKMPNVNYFVIVDVIDVKGNVGDVTVSDKLTNGFKLSYDGGASEVTLNYTVIGGYLK